MLYIIWMYLTSVCALDVHAIHIGIISTCTVRYKILVIFIRSTNLADIILVNAYAILDIFCILS